jgi:nucleoside-diphosphate-sugar epimerase
MDAKGTIDAAKHGALNVVEQAGKAKVKRIVVTSSVAALYHPANPPTTQTEFDENSWSDATEEQVLANPDNAFFAYMASKALAEKAVWDWAEKNPQVDVTTIVPSFMFGPFAPGYEVKKGDIGAMSSNAFPFQILAAKPGGEFPPIPNHLFLDIREGARAHVVALRAPLAKDVGRKRILVNSGSLSWVEVTEFWPKARFALRGKLPDTKTGSNVKLPASMSTKRAAELLNMQTFKDLDSLMEETADDLLRVLGEWAKETDAPAAAPATETAAKAEKAGSPTTSEKKPSGFKRAVHRVSSIFA